MINGYSLFELAFCRVESICQMFRIKYLGFLLNFKTNQWLNVKQRPAFFMIKVRRFNVGLTHNTVL